VLVALFFIKGKNMSKVYIMRGAETVYVKSYVKSEKTPDDFSSAQEFYAQAEKIHESTDSVNLVDWDTIEESDAI
jgi:hypothetical protein